MKRLRSFFLSAAFLVPTVLLPTVAAVPVFAAENSSSKPEQDENADLMPWRWANFAILVVGLGYLINKNLMPVLAARSAGIAEGLAAGERAKAEAEARAQAVQVKLDGLAGAVSALKAQAAADRAHEAARLRHESDLEMARISQHAAEEIESATKIARLDLQRHAAKLAIELATQKIRSRMNGEVQAALIENFIGGLSDRSEGTLDKSKTL